MIPKSNLRAASFILCSENLKFLINIHFQQLASHPFETVVAQDVCSLMGFVNINGLYHIATATVLQVKDTNNEFLISPSLFVVRQERFDSFR
jgi:hypothetical protein